MTAGIPTRFPFRLHRMLDEASQNGRDDLICWLPCGTKFRIRNQTEFAKTIMSKYCRHAKYKSFLRQLSMYKFQRVSSGPEKGSYYHPHFLRHRLDLAEAINRENIKDIPAAMLMPATAINALSFTDASDSKQDHEVDNIFSWTPGQEEAIVRSVSPLDDKKLFYPVQEAEAELIDLLPQEQSPLDLHQPMMTSDDILNEIICTFC